MYNLDAEFTEVLIFDSKTGKTIKFNCLDLSTEDKIKFRAEHTKALVDSKGNTEKTDLLKLAWGEKIITGMTPGYFEINGKPVSTDKKDTLEKYEKNYAEYQDKLKAWNELKPNKKLTHEQPKFEDAVYYPGWFSVLKSKRPDLIWAVVDSQLGQLSVVIKEEQLPFFEK